MKKLLLLLLFIPLVSFGQTKTVNINAKIDNDPKGDKAYRESVDRLRSALRESNRIRAEEMKDRWSKTEFDNFTQKANKYKYVVLKEDPSLTRYGVKAIIGLLKTSTYNYEIINLNKPNRTFKTLPQEYYKKNDVVFLEIIDQDVGVYSRIDKVILEDNSGTIFESTHKNKVTKEILAPLLRKRNYNSKDNREVYNNQPSDDLKNNAIEELKKLKELLDLELITKEEFDKKSKELKKIILDN